MILNFRWFILGKLAGSSKPCYGEDVEYIVSHGIRALISLELTSDVIYSLLKKNNIEVFIFPLDTDDSDDIIVPTKDDMKKLENFFSQCLLSGKPVLVHCSAGIKRTGFIGRYLKDRFEKN